MGTYVITEPCIDVKDGACVEVCPVACIHTVTEASQYFIDPEVCIECEQCVIVCPVDAIYVDTEVPERWKGFIEMNAKFFQELKPAAEPISAEFATKMIAAATDYAAREGASLAVVVVDQVGEVIAQRQMEPTDPAAFEGAVANAQKAAASGVRSPGSHAVFDRLEIVGGMGAAGGTPEQNTLAVRAGIAAGADTATAS